MNVEKLSEQLHDSAAAAPSRRVDLDAVVSGAKRVRRRRRIAAAAAGLLVVAAGTTTGALTLTDGQDRGSTIAPQPLPSRSSAPAPSAPPTSQEPEPTQVPSAVPPLAIVPAGAPGALPPYWSAASTRPSAFFLSGAVVGNTIVYWSHDRGDDSRHDYRGEGAVFDVTSRSWSLTPASPIAGRYGAATAGNNGLFFVWGGDGITDEGDLRADGATYGVITKTWRTVAPAPLPAMRPLGGTWDGGRFVVVGEKASAAYDPVSDSWTRLPSMATPPSEASVVQVGDRTYVIGPYSYYLTPGADAWTPIPSLPNAVVSTTIAATDGQTLFAGAATGSRQGPISAPLIVDRFDPATATWVALPPSPAQEVNCYPPLAVTPRNIFNACGSSALYDRSTGTWTEYERVITVSDAVIAVGRSIVFIGDPTLVYTPP